jgi:hypothetical protein
MHHKLLSDLIRQIDLLIILTDGDNIIVIPRIIRCAPHRPLRVDLEIEIDAYGDRLIERLERTVADQARRPTFVIVPRTRMSLTNSGAWALMEEAGTVMSMGTCPSCSP